jgi:hypothetical protein
MLEVMLRWIEGDIDAKNLTASLEKAFRSKARVLSFVSQEVGYREKVKTHQLNLLFDTNIPPQMAEAIISGIAGKAYFAVFEEGEYAKA